MPKLPAILVAMPEELAPFLPAFEEAAGRLETTKTKQLAGATFRKIEVDGKPALLVTTGIGLVNAAAAATLAISEFGADLLISSGSAGGVGQDVRVGDVVVSAETCYSTADATAFTNYALGQIPQMPPRFIANAALLRARDSVTPAVASAQNDGGVVSLPSVEEPVTAVSKPRELHQGLILSSDAFIWEKNYADYVGKFPDALATDMETAAIGQVAYKFGVPWVSVRGISDLCGPAGPDDFYTHLDGAANIAAEVVMQLVRDLP